MNKAIFIWRCSASPPQAVSMMEKAPSSGGFSTTVKPSLRIRSITSNDSVNNAGKNSTSPCSPMAYEQNENKASPLTSPTATSQHQPENSSSQTPPGISST